ncbi:TetR/AcrR family transcriptional regulator [Mycobacterium sp. AZCC_0083]|uniref:TetR/AcrR family transcriptional regulator n=1 Tax=Mycobacterium sp. AZCC_0083 TaxID=2735882 RepID=UPI00160B7D8C|nr:TetR family transcriptional regulator C-terminal domain-containing protein [Mycobacterium sp. AZCC_0083]MBB5162475.1 AcrR family transcriptional regulator [Mycobacterium sp. AZCC_0083]
MASTATSSRPRRKSPEVRKGEIADAAGQVATADGLAQLTAKRVAEAVGVYPGLVNHYFRSADELVAAGFAAATERRREQQAAKIAEAADDPLAELRMFLHDAISPDHDAAALLWLDAWRECPRRPALQREVVRQMELDLADLTDILDRGVVAGRFASDDTATAAMRILAMIDGMFAQSAVRTAIAGTVFLNYPVVAEMLLRTTEHELGLEAGVLD